MRMPLTPVVFKSHLWKVAEADPTLGFSTVWKRQVREFVSSGLRIWYQIQDGNLGLSTCNVLRVLTQSSEPGGKPDGLMVTISIVICKCKKSSNSWNGKDYWRWQLENDSKIANDRNHLLLFKFFLKSEAWINWNIFACSAPVLLKSLAGL